MGKRKVDDDLTSKTKMEIDQDEEDSGDDASTIDVDLDFLGLNSDIDFLGLKTLLKQLFDIDNELVELSQLADLILSQADHVGTAVKCDGEESDPFSFITVLNLSQHRENETIKKLITYLEGRLAPNKHIKEILQLPSKATVGLVLSERLINMPHQVVPPMYNMLQKEMAASAADFTFTHLLVVSKTYTELQSSLDAEEDRPQKKARGQKTSEVFYFHPEDEVFKQSALAEQSFKYQNESAASSSDSRRAFQDEGYVPQGYAVLLDGTKFSSTVQAITQYFGTS